VYYLENNVDFCYNVCMIKMFEQYGLNLTEEKISLKIAGIISKKPIYKAGKS
jgi:hypothetical protein